MERRHSRRLRLQSETGRIELPLHVVKSSIERNNLWLLNYIYAHVLSLESVLNCIGLERYSTLPG